MLQDKDMVNQPSHYTNGGIENIDYIKAKLTPEEFRGFCKGNALKYLGRANEKGEEQEDREKAEWYLLHLRTGEKALKPQGMKLTPFDVDCNVITDEACRARTGCNGCPRLPVPAPGGGLEMIKPIHYEHKTLTCRVCLEVRCDLSGVCDACKDIDPLKDYDEEALRHTDGVFIALAGGGA